MAADINGLTQSLKILQGAFTTPPETPTIILLLTLAGRPDGTASMKELRQEIGLGSSSMTRQIGLLGMNGYRNGPNQSDIAGIGLVQSWEDPVDRREKLVRLTPVGEALVAKALHPLKLNKSAGT